jgi:hypothetical protein
MAILDAFLLQVVGTLTSTLTAALLAWAVSILRDMRETTEENERRSVRNTRALRQSGITRPAAGSDIPPEYQPNRSENMSGSD